MSDLPPAADPESVFDISQVPPAATASRQLLATLAQYSDENGLVQVPAEVVLQSIIAAVGELEARLMVLESDASN